MERLFKIVPAALAVIALGVLLYTLLVPNVVTRGSSVETIYIVNRSHNAISDHQIKSDIPAWEKAAAQFAAVWNTDRVKLVLVKSAPEGAISAIFLNSGRVQGALAYHASWHGAPQIVVYAGVGNLYRFDNSISFTHELFEMLADRNINTWTWHWQSQYPLYYLNGHAEPLARGAIWFNEVCDPVEARAYRVDGVLISDWITPNWFNAQQNGQYDEMNLVHEPFQVLIGGYAQYMVKGQYNLIEVFRGAGKDASGFYKGEKKLAHAA